MALCTKRRTKQELLKSYIDITTLLSTQMTMDIFIYVTIIAALKFNLNKLHNLYCKQVTICYAVHIINIKNKGN